MSQKSPQNTPGQPYKVLARSYRPQSFAEMIGQDVLVKTLTNAIESGRLPHAYMLTGIRGVGKTTTARVLAKALNCVGKDGKGGPTTSPCGECENCIAISTDSHVDVLEMDAASRTGVDDIRELIEGVQYKATQSRYKVYIIDEVHMLSKNAFNALLKTLEEPPAHVKFIFATTEIRKVPVTILSRCQRFDLRRVNQDELEKHFAHVASQEKIDVEPEAIALIARAADGSVRDGMSLLEQALTIKDDKNVSAELVRSMLGLVDRTALFDLFETLMKGETSKALEILHDMHTHGAEVKTVLTDMLDLVHWMSVLCSAPGRENDLAYSKECVLRGKDLAQNLSLPILTRTWQILLKGVEEVSLAHAPLAAADMVLMRLCHVAKMPTPDQLVARIKEEGATAPASKASDKAAPLQEETAAQTDTSAPTELPKSYLDVVDLCMAKGEVLLHAALKSDVHLVSFQPQEIKLRLSKDINADLTKKLATHLKEWTGEQWVVMKSSENGEPTLFEQEEAKQKQEKDAAAQDPSVKAVLEAFPGAEIKKVQQA